MNTLSFNARPLNFSGDKKALTVESTPFQDTVRVMPRDSSSFVESVGVDRRLFENDTPSFIETVTILKTVSREKTHETAFMDSAFIVVHRVSTRSESEAGKPFYPIDAWPDTMSVKNQTSNNFYGKVGC